MAEYDLVIRNTTIATAADVVKGDVGISAGRVVALGERLDKGKKEIDATGLVAAITSNRKWSGTTRLTGN